MPNLVETLQTLSKQLEAGERRAMEVPPILLAAVKEIESLRESVRLCTQEMENWHERALGALEPTKFV